jgi:hydroxymethylglutaryl-CoA lyase
MAIRFSNFSKIVSQFKDKVKKNNIQLPNFVKIVEVGPRDGLQNEKQIVPTPKKIEFINKLTDAGFKAIECTSFVSPKWVPQMGDNSEVFLGIKKKDGVSYPVLVPNVKGLETAVKVGVKEIAVFGAASESFSKKNINCSIEESFDRFKAVIDEAKKHNLKIRGYVSCVMGCPYEGDVDPEKVNLVAERLYQMGCYEISLGDTIGVGTPEKTHKMFRAIKNIPKENLAAHFHDTYDKAVENLMAALEEGISIMDSSTAGLGGCPYAGKAAGNVCTENVLYMLKELGIETGVDIKKVQEAGNWISNETKRQNLSLLEITKSL